VFSGSLGYRFGQKYRCSAVKTKIGIFGDFRIFRVQKMLKLIFEEIRKFGRKSAKKKVQN